MFEIHPSPLLFVDIETLLHIFLVSYVAGKQSILMPDYRAEWVYLTIPCLTFIIQTQSTPSLSSNIKILVCDEYVCSIHVELERAEFFDESNVTNEANTFAHDDAYHINQFDDIPSHNDCPYQNKHTMQRILING